MMLRIASHTESLGHSMFTQRKSRCKGPEAANILVSSKPVKKPVWLWREHVPGRVWLEKCFLLSPELSFLRKYSSALL